MTALRLIAAILFPSATLAAQHLDYSKVVVSARRVAPGVYLLQGAGANVGVFVGSGRPLVVDVEFAALTDRILAKIATLSPRPVQYLVNTHWHSDHTGGNEEMAKRGVIIVAQENVRRRMSTTQVIEIEHDTTPPSPAAALPTRTFASETTLVANGDSIRIMHMRHAHTDGDAIVHSHSANVVLMGDIYFAGGYPFIDVSTGGSLAGMIAACDRVLALSNATTKIVPGHGRVTSRMELQAYRDMLEAVRRRVSALIARGRTREEVIAAKPLAQFDARWGHTFVPSSLFLSIVDESLRADGR